MTTAEDEKKKRRHARVSIFLTKGNTLIKECRSCVQKPILSPLPPLHGSSQLIRVLPLIGICDLDGRKKKCNRCSPLGESADRFFTLRYSFFKVSFSRGRGVDRYGYLI